MKLLVIAVAAIGVAAAVTFRPKAKPSVIVGSQYFYDLGDNKLYTEKPGAEAPVVAPSGKVGVAAAVFACGSCESESARFTAYLTRNSDAYVRASSTGEPVPDEIARNGTLFRGVEGGEWMTRDHPAVIEMITNLQGRCPKTNPLKTCMP